MPTQFTNCAECDYDTIVKKYYKENDNCKYLYDLHNENLEKQKILMNVGNLNEELTINIIKMANILEKCSYCNNLLCKKHLNKAAHWGKYYKGNQGGFMCNKCCWWEVT